MKYTLDELEKILGAIFDDAREVQEEAEARQDTIDVLRSSLDDLIKDLADQEQRAWAGDTMADRVKAGSFAYAIHRIEHVRDGVLYEPEEDGGARCLLN